MDTLFRILAGSEIDEAWFEITLAVVRYLFYGLWVLSGWVMAQSEDQPAGLSELPSTKAPAKIPGLDEAAPSPGPSGLPTPESPSVPKLRLPEKETDKTKDQDWAAQAMLQKKEEAKKKEQEQAALAEQKAKESQQALEKEKKEKQAKANPSTQPAIAKSAAPSVAGGADQKLPAVTGLEGVTPRAMASGDGRVQPGFDAFTGPSATGPMGKDFQSGAKPIMPGATTADGRMQVPPKAPEPPSGGYKRISQDPYSTPAGYGEKKPVTPPPAPVVIPPNPPSGDPKRVIDNTKAGLSPYDNSKQVPDPRSQRRF